jgi:predicted dehydrogenase
MMGAHVRNGFAPLWGKGYRGFEIVACCDAVEQSAAGMAAEIGEWQGATPKVYGDVERLLAGEGDLHAVDISVTHSEHHKAALPCLDAKKHVMIEKPLAMTMRAAKKMRDAADANGVLLNVAENYRRSPANRAANWVIKSGRLGRLRQFYWIDCQERLWHWGWRDELDQAGGGWTFDGGVHFADLMRYHVGPVARATALTRQYNTARYLDREDPQKGTKEATIEDTAMALLEFENGATGVWVESIVSPGQGMGSHIVYGEEGSLDFGAGLKLRGQEQPTPIGQLTEEFLAQLSADEKGRLFPFGLQDTISQEVHEFVEACLHGGSLETDAVEGYKAQAVCMAVYESAALGGRPVELSRIENLEIETYQSGLNAKIGL